MKKREKKRKSRSDRWRRRWNWCENKREVVWKQNRKEDEACGKENENKGELRGW